MNRKISLVIPAYKEKDNIEPLVTRLSVALAGYQFEIVIMDDNSRDGSEELVQSLSAQFPVKIIVRRDKKGLASAVVDGFEHAASDIIVVMDADLQHPPEVVPSLVEAIYQGGCRHRPRYIEGRLRGWGVVRRIISKELLYFPHVLPSTRKSRTRCRFLRHKREVVKDAKLNPSGFKILLEILMLENGSRPSKCPLCSLRSRGESKLNAKQQLDLKHITA